MASETTKPAEESASAAAAGTEQKQETTTKPAALGEDDEFEDFPVDGTSARTYTHTALFSMGHLHLGHEALGTISC